MKTLFFFCILICTVIGDSYSNNGFDNSLDGGYGFNIDLVPVDNPKPKPDRGPKAPLRTSIICYFYDNNLTVYSDNQPISSISILNSETGEQFIVEELEDDYQYTVSLDNYTRDKMIVTIEAYGIAYIGHF